MTCLTLENGMKLAYCRTEGTQPGVIFLSGFRSDMTGTKATGLESWAVAQGRGFLRFDYSGHGQSTGNFEDGTIGGWAGDALAVLDELTTGPQILVGSSMGGWMALLLALARPERVAGVVTVAAAPDFTTRLIWEQLTQQQKEIMAQNGVYYAPSEYGDPYPITMALIEESRQHLLLDNDIAIDCPARLLHGMQDADVPWEFSTQVAQRLQSPDVQVRLVKDGDHRMSEPEHIHLLIEMVEALIVSV